MEFAKTGRLGISALVLVGTLMVTAPRAEAQGAGGGGMPPEMMAKIKAWQKWGEQHKKLTQLGDLIGQVQEMDKDPNAQLNKPQAGKMLGIIKPLRTKGALSEDQAQDTIKKMNGVLNLKQIKKIATIEPASARMRRGFGGGRPGGGGGPGGGARPGGPRPGGGGFPDPPAGGWNPFNPDTMPFKQARPAMKQRMDAFIGDLEHRAKG
jgi:hypothetical protein